MVFAPVMSSVCRLVLSVFHERITQYSFQTIKSIQVTERYYCGSLQDGR